MRRICCCAAACAHIPTNEIQRRVIIPILLLVAVSLATLFGANVFFATPPVYLTAARAAAVPIGVCVPPDLFFVLTSGGGARGG
jgi:hypothetical protein